LHFVFDTISQHLSILNDIINGQFGYSISYDRYG
jgi:hypothetical protein